MLVPLPQLLKEAQEFEYAVPAVDVHNLETVEATVSAAAQCQSPVIIAFAQSHYVKGYAPLSALVKLVVDAIERHKVRACLHIDHGRDEEFLREAVNLGVNSVMIDASEQPLEKNIEIVSKVVDYMHERGVAVEAELGHVGKGESFESYDARENYFTAPDEAKRFVLETGVDALAIAFGTKHGIYKHIPKLDFSRIMSIKQVASVPLVMHGTSGVSASDIEKAVQAGISKVNVFTDPALAAKEAFLDSCQAKETRFPDALVQARNAFQERVHFYMNVCGSSGRG